MMAALLYLHKFTHLHVKKGIYSYRKAGTKHYKKRKDCWGQVAYVIEGINKTCWGGGQIRKRKVQAEVLNPCCQENENETKCYFQDDRVLIVKTFFKGCMT